MRTDDRPRYDGIADWYDDFAAPSAASSRSTLESLLGPGEGRCLDLACGTGRYVDVIRSTGRSVVGLDLSADQLRVARTRTTRLVRADATALPFADGTFSTVVSLWGSTDIDDFDAALHEIARVLSPGGLLLFYGVHPAFNGPGIEFREDGGRVVHPVYREAGWHEGSPWWTTHGVRDRVGMRHVPLSDLINSFLGAGLRLSQVVEPGEDPVPMVLAMLVHRP